MKLLAIDANAIVNRAYYGIRPLVTKSGEYTNGIYGFLNILYKLIEQRNPDYIVCAFDLKDKTFRHKLYEDYKAKRHAMPMELVSQIPLLKEVLNALNIKYLEVSGYEADDILGTLSNYCDQRDIDCDIATGDRDALSLVTKNTKVLLATTKQTGSETIEYDEAAVFEKYKVKPKNLVDIKAIWGDASDNIPGVKGIGEKGAMELISKFNTIEYIYDNIDTIDIKEPMREKLKESKDSAFLSKTLATIDKNVPVDINLNEFKLKEPDYEKTQKLFTRLELNSFLKKMESNLTSEEIKIEEIKDLEFLKTVRSECAVYLNKNELILCYENKLYKISKDDFDYMTYNTYIGGFFENNVKKLAYDAKNLIFELKKEGVEVKNISDDVMLMAYVLNPISQNYSLRELCAFYLSKQTKDDVDAVLYMHNLRDKLSQLLKISEGEYVYREIELKLTYVLADMQYEGFKVDKKALEEFMEEISKRIDVLTEEIYSMCGKFNINSPKQLGQILFEKLGLPVIKKTKSGYATGAEILQRLIPEHPVIEKLLEYRMLTKLYSTYGVSLLKEIGEDGKIHSSFNQTITATGRISSTEPNLQNIPIRQEITGNIRKMFVPSDNESVLCDADYNQIELRVLAHISDDENMKKGFLNNEDIHTNTAAAVFNVDPKYITPDMRRKAKAVNFGIVYGISDFSLANDLKITKNQAKEYIKKYLAHYSKVDEYMRSIVLKARQEGCVKTLFKRVRPIPEITSTNYNIRSFGERVALNAPIQGTAADIIKIAMINVYNALKERNLKSKLILQVHDELIVNTKKSELKEVMDIIKTQMEKAADLSVKLEVSVHYGDNWYDAK